MKNPVQARDLSLGLEPLYSSCSSIATFATFAIVFWHYCLVRDYAHPLSVRRTEDTIFCSKPDTRIPNGEPVSMFILTSYGQGSIQGYQQGY